MARMRRRTTVSRGTSPRRKFVWARYTAQGANQGADVAFRDDMLTSFNTAYGADLLGATVVRIRGFMAIEGANFGDSLLLSGLVEATPSAVAIPGDGPVHRPFADWMMLEPFNWTGRGDVTEARMIDNQSARKIEELGDQLSVYVATSGGNAGPLDWSLYLSIGLKLP